MRLSLLICCLLLFNTLIGQDWQQVEWITKDSQRDTGWVKMPFFFWKTPSSIKLKHEESGSSFEGDQLFFLKELSGDTLLFTTFYKGRYRTLQKIVKGDVALCREVKKGTDNYFLLINGEVSLWNQYDVKHDIFDLLNTDDPYFYERISFANKEELLKVLRRLNHEKSIERFDRKKDRISKRKKEKWKKTKKKKEKIRKKIEKRWLEIGMLLSSSEDQEKVINIVDQNKVHLYIGVDRYLEGSRHHFSLGVDIAYKFTGEKDIYSRNRVKYNREIKISVFKAYAGIRFELLPSRRCSPYVEGGLVFSLFPRFSHELTAPNGATSLNGLPINQTVKAKLPWERGSWKKIGCRFNLSESTRIDLMLQLERFNKLIDFRDYAIEMNLLDIGKRRVLLDEQIMGFSITRAF